LFVIIYLALFVVVIISIVNKLCFSIYLQCHVVCESEKHNVS